MKILAAVLLMTALISGCTGADTPVPGVDWDLTANGWQCRKVEDQPDGGEFTNNSDCEGLEKHDRRWPND